MTQDDYIRTALRVPPDLHQALHQAADAGGKSFNAEIIGRLIASFEADGKPTLDQSLLTLFKVTLSISSKFVIDEEVRKTVKTVLDLAGDELNLEKIHVAQDAFKSLLREMAARETAGAKQSQPAPDSRGRTPKP